MQQLDLRQRFVHRMALTVLLIGIAGSTMLAFLHQTEAQPHLASLVMPWVLCSLAVIAAAALLLVPRRTRLIMYGFILMAVLMLTISTWVFVLEAGAPNGPKLTQLLPPTLPGLITINLIAIVFLRPRVAFRIGALSWLLIGLPILVHLLQHRELLATARGQEMLVLLGPAMLLILVLIPYQREAEKRLQDLTRDELRARALAERDPLTDLFNRRAFEEMLIDRIAESRDGVQLILFDIDHFKRINDTHGHAVGDQVLRDVVARAAAQLSRGAQLARWGGEEFVLLARADDDASLAERLRLSIAAKPIPPAGKVTASFGVTLVRRTDTPEAVFERADRALYVAKSAGRNRIERA